MNFNELPGEWRTRSLAEIGRVPVAKLDPRACPEELFEYYSIPAYQKGASAALTAGAEILSHKLLIPPRCVLFGKLNPRVEKVWNVRSTGGHRRLASTEWLTLRPTEEVDQDFLYFLMYSKWVMPIAKTLVSGSTPSRQRVNEKAFFEIRVPLPGIREQRRLGYVLGLVHGALEACRSAITAGTALRAEAMRTLFTRGRRSEPTKETEIGPMPRSWRLSNIGALFKIEQGLSLKGNLSTGDDGTPFLRTSNVYWGRLDLRSISRMQLSEGAPATKELRPGDLLVCEGGDIGRAAVWNGELKGCVFQNHLHRLRPLPSASGDAVRPHFVRAWLEEGFVNRNAYEGAGNRTTIPNLSRSRLADLAVPDPPLDEQREIVAILDAIARKIGLHRRKLAVLEQLFRTLLHDLMTGRIRADDIDLPNLGTSVDVGGIQGTRE